MNCTVTYAELRQLHINYLKALTNKKAKEPARNTNIDTGLFRQLLKMQTAYPT